MSGAADSEAGRALMEQARSTTYSSGMEPTNPERPERDFVDLDDPRDVEAWTSALHISKSELERVVEIAGSSAGEVYDYVLRSRQMAQPPG